MQILNEIYKQLEKEDRPKEYFYVTDLGTCPRKVIMNFGDYKKKPMTNAEKIMFFKADSDHKSMARLLNKSNRFFIIREEFNISEGLPKMWHGRLDNLLYDREEKSISPIDWKGTRSLKYQAELPKQSHILQIRAYLMALINMRFPVDKGIIIYMDRTGSYEGIEFVIEPDNDSVLAEMKIYEDYLINQYEFEKYTIDSKCLKIKSLDTFSENNQTRIFSLRNSSLLPQILCRDIKQIKNEFYLIPNWQCSYCYYQGLSCEPNMSKNKIAEIKDNKLKIRKGYEEYKNRLNELINPKDNENFYNFVKGVSDK